MRSVFDGPYAPFEVCSFRFGHNFLRVKRMKPSKVVLDRVVRRFCDASVASWHIYFGVSSPQVRTIAWKIHRRSPRPTPNAVQYQSLMDEAMDDAGFSAATAREIECILGQPTRFGLDYGVWYAVTAPDSLIASHPQHTLAARLGFDSARAFQQALVDGRFLTAGGQLRENKFSARVNELRRDNRLELIELAHAKTRWRRRRQVDCIL